MNKYESFMVNWIVENQGIQSKDIDVKANFFEREYLDSLSVFGMVMDIEDNFDIKLEPDHLLADNATSIEGLAAIIKCHNHNH